MTRYRGGYNKKTLEGGGVASSALDALEGKWGVRVHQTQEMKGKEGSGDLAGREAKSGLASSGHGLDTPGKKAFLLMEVEGGRGRVRGWEREDK